MSMRIGGTVRMVLLIGSDKSRVTRSVLRHFSIRVLSFRIWCMCMVAMPMGMWRMGRRMRSR